VLDARPARSPWLSRIEASLVVTKWVSGYLSQHPEIKDQRVSIIGSLALPAGSLADFRRFASTEGLTVPEGTDADRLLSRLLLLWLADSAWGESAAYQVIALTDPEVEAARLALDRK
jgi:hypothetical protein